MFEKGGEAAAQLAKELQGGGEAAAHLANSAGGSKIVWTGDKAVQHMSISGCDAIGKQGPNAKLTARLQLICQAGSENMIS